MTIDIEEKVTEFLKKYDLQDKTLIVGFSGGYDSMCLLNILSNLKKNVEFEYMNIIAAHFNHNWRGEESLKEQEVCRLFASSRGIQFYTKFASGEVKKTENDAREARYEFFDDAKDFYDADAILTAHNRDDNAETVLYRIIKGTGIYGLKGISEKRDYFYRPLLQVSREEILNYCSYQNLTPNNDSSNHDIKYFRNLIRLNILPVLEKINPSVKEALTTLSEVAINEDSIITEYLTGIKNSVICDDCIDTTKYIPLSEAAKKRLIYDYIRSFNLDYDYKRISDLYNFIDQNLTKRNGSTTSLTASQWLYVDDKIIEVIPRKKEQDASAVIRNFEEIIHGEGTYTVNDRTFSIEKYTGKENFLFPPASSNFAYVDLSNVKFPLRLRTRREGDIINPFGMQGSMKLKKYLNAKGVTRHRRDEVVVLANGEEILWVAGVGLSNKIGVTKTPTHIIKLSRL